MDKIAPAFATAEQGLCTLNIALIEALCALMGLQPDLVRSSATPVRSVKAQRLADLCLRHGAARYVSPPGSKDYLDGDEALAKAGVDLEYFAYEHPSWQQLNGAFAPYMSTLDLVMNALPDALDILRSGMRSERPA